MKSWDFDYELPEELIAQAVLKERSDSRLLWLHRDSGRTEHRKFADLPLLLGKGDLLVLNNTRVTARRLFGHRATGGKVEALLLRPTEGGIEALTRPASKLRPGTELTFDGFKAKVVEDKGEGRKLLEFEDPLKVFQSAGSIPLPPYFYGSLDDEERYQTVFARHGGSAAAPTAGLHFTPSLLKQVQDRGVNLAYVTLSVGLDTFRPVSTDSVADHVIHGEECSLPAETAQAVHECKGRVIAVGTTTTRTLESFAVGKRQLSEGTQVSRIFITPGYEFKVVDGIVTNFHMPRTTMLFMLAALVGREALLGAYQEAVDKRYRFLSFGDSMLIV